MQDGDDIVSQQLVTDVRAVVDQVRDSEILERTYRENPYLVLAAAAGVGYIVGGGLFSPFTRRLVRIGMKAMFVPIAATQLKGLAGGGPNAGE